MVSAPVKPAAAKSPNSLPKPKPATARVAASSGRQTKLTSSVRVVARPSEPTAKLSTPARPVVTKAAASQPRVVLPPPKKQPAPIVPRTTLPVPAPAKLKHPFLDRIRNRPAHKRTVPAKPALKAPKNLRLVKVDAAAIEKRLKLAVEASKSQCCSNHSDPAHSGRDPELRRQKEMPQCLFVRDSRSEQESHKFAALPSEGHDEDSAKFVQPCRSSRQIQNRSSAAPKAKTVQFADPMVSEYRCIPWNKDEKVWAIREDTTYSWDPSKEELASFRANAKTC